MSLRRSHFCTDEKRSHLINIEAIGCQGEAFASIAFRLGSDIRAQMLCPYKHWDVIEAIAFLHRWEAIAFDKYGGDRTFINIEAIAFLHRWGAIALHFPFYSISNSLKIVLTGKKSDRFVFLKGTKPWFNQNAFACSFLVSTRIA